MTAPASYRPGLRRIALALAAAPLALGLAACSKDASETAVPSGAPLAKVAPPAGKAWSDVAVVTPDGGYQMGNPQAPIKLVEFGALSCSHCAEFSEKASAEIRDNFVASGRVSYELRFMMNNFLDIPAVPNTQDRSPIGEMIKRCNLLRQPNRVTLRNQGDARRQLQLRGYRCCGSESEKLIMGSPVLFRQRWCAFPSPPRSGSHGGNVGVLRNPHGVVPASLKLTSKLGGLNALIGWEYECTDFHGIPCGRSELLCS